jgi:ribonuclease-3
VNASQEDRELSRLEASLGHVFERRVLLETALRHSSHANESGSGASNERLEFLGDAVIGLVIAHQLHDANPLWREGDLTRALSRLVDRSSLADAARRLNIGPFIQLGRTERQSHGEEKDSILADAMEAVIGAIYLDAGLERVISLAQRLFEEALSADAPVVDRDPKTRFQERVMKQRSVFPTYEHLSDTGIEGDPSRFRVRVLVGDDECASAEGRTKKAAERAAAEAAYEVVFGGAGPADRQTEESQHGEGS